MFKLGIVGLSKIATTKVIPSILTDMDITISAIATKSIEFSAFDWMKDAIIYEDYYSILNNRELDGLYVSLPNNMHANYALHCLKNNQNAIIEKPLFLSINEANFFYNISKYKSIIIEGFMYKYHPQWIKIINELRNETLGLPISAKIHISYICKDSNNIRYNKKLGGGAMFDIGVYCFSMARLIFNEEPLCIEGKQIIDKKYDIDIYNEGLIKFNKGNVEFKISFNEDRTNFVEIQCERGKIILNEALNPRLDEVAKVIFIKNGNYCEFTTEKSNQFYNQFIAFKNICKQNTLFEGLADPINNIKAIEKFINVSEKKYVTNSTI